MIKELATIAKVKIWFATVNKYKEYQARKKLAEYVKTLSPEKQAWANDLRARLEADPKRAINTLREENTKLFDKHAEVTKRLGEVVTHVTN